jgi:hypothetical protein
MGKGWLTSNPCRGVRRNKERGSLKYVENKAFVEAMNRAPPEMYALYGTAYLLGIRQTDLVLAEESQITEVLGSDGRPKLVLRVTESKGGKLNEHEITPTVLLMLTKAKEHKESVAARYDAAAANLERLSQKRRAAASRAKAAAEGRDRQARDDRSYRSDAAALYTSPAAEGREMSICREIALLVARLEANQIPREHLCCELNDAEWQELEKELQRDLSYVSNLTVMGMRVLRNSDDPMTATKVRQQEDDFWGRLRPPPES